MKDNIIIVIPAYNPNEKLKFLVNNLKNNGFNQIILINDGSEKEEIFNEIKKDITYLKHEENRGKGQALKTGFKFYLQNHSNKLGIITADADGQHTIEDIEKVYRTFKKYDNSLILGCRNFNDSNIPARSKFGNLIFRKILKIKTKINISDTQTGLRAIPTNLIKEFCEIKGEKFEYETNVLIYCCKNKINIQETKIQSIYIDKNKSSHFKPIKDSLTIIKLLFK